MCLRLASNSESSDIICCSLFEVFLFCSLQNQIFQIKGVNKNKQACDKRGTLCAWLIIACELRKLFQNIILLVKTAKWMISPKKYNIEGGGGVRTTQTECRLMYIKKKTKTGTNLSCLIGLLFPRGLSWKMRRITVALNSVSCYKPNSCLKLNLVHKTLTKALFIESHETELSQC